MGRRAPALRALIDAFYDRVASDDLLAAFFPGGVTQEHRDHVADWSTEVFGGPAAHTERHGGCATMLAHHRGLGITSEQRHRFVALMSLAADDAGLPDDPEFRSALLAYVEWGTRLAMANSSPARSSSSRRRCPVGAGARPRPGPAEFAAPG